MLLDQLPLELLLHVLSYLTTPEYSDVRLASKDVKDATYDRWAQEFFATRQFSMLPHSLSVLVAISKHEILSPYLRRLIIGSDGLANVPLLEGPAVLTPAQQSRFIEYYKDDRHFAACGLDQQYLAEAVRNLQNLTAIEVRNFSSDFAGGRVRDGVAWKSYGWSVIKEATGAEPSYDSHPIEYREFEHVPHDPSVLCSKVLLAAIECRRLTSFIFQSRRRSPYGQADVELHALWVAEPVRTRYKKGLQHLETIMLNIQHPIEDSGDDSQNLSKFLSQTPRLKHLRLNCDWRRPNHFITTTLEPCAPSLEDLTVIELGNTMLAHAELERLGSFKSIQELTFFRITLYDGTWASLLPQLAATMPSLRTMALISVRQQVPQDEVAGVTPKRNARVAFTDTPGRHVESMADPSLSNSLTVTDKRDTDLDSAIIKALELIVVDDVEFRRARGLLRTYADIGPPALENEDEDGAEAEDNDEDEDEEDDADDADDDSENEDETDLASILAADAARSLPPG